MHKTIAVFLFAALAACASDALAVPTINVGNWSFPQNSGVHEIPIYVTGGPNDFLGGLNFVAMTGDGGPSTTENVNDPTGKGTSQGVVPAPNITANADTLTSPWGATLLNSTSSRPQEDFGVGKGGTQTVMASIAAAGSEISMDGTHLLGIISVDTNNTGISTGPYPGDSRFNPPTDPTSAPNYAAIGTYHFDMGGSPRSDIVHDTDGMPVPTNYSDGGPLHEIPQTYFSVTDGTITITAAPEPSTLMLAVVGLAGLAIWRWRRRYSA